MPKPTLETVLRAIDEYFADTTRDAIQTRDGLETIAADVEEKLECLAEDADF